MILRPSGMVVCNWPLIGTRFRWDQIEDLELVPTKNDNRRTLVATVRGRRRTRRIDCAAVSAMRDDEWLQRTFAEIRSRWERETGRPVTPAGSAPVQAVASG